MFLSSLFCVEILLRKSLCLNIIIIACLIFDRNLFTVVYTACCSVLSGTYAPKGQLYSKFPFWGVYHQFMIRNYILPSAPSGNFEHGYPHSNVLLELTCQKRKNGKLHQ